MPIIAKLSPAAWNQPLKVKIFAVVGFLIAMISAFIFVYLPQKLEAQATRNLHDKAASISQMTAFSVGSALYFGDQDAGHEALLGASLNDELVSIVVFDRRDTVFASYGPVAGHGGTSFADAGTTYLLETPIHLLGDRLGTLHTTFSLLELQREVRRARVTVAVISLLVCGIGSILVFSISSVMNAPLRNMLLAVAQIDRGDWWQRAEVRSSDEMGMLAASFNDMVESVQSRTHDLEQEIG